ncbi:MAG: cbb3-type cytochrome c oxidase subunit 3 [Gammaproteobacteria bacterium]|nr:cbb3-type cytochrome c oxidase subunit 3 [Gammaproteobacteria bacterium]
MDMNDLRGIATVLCMVAFLSVVFWAYSSKRKKDFEEASMLPFSEKPETPSELEDTE